MLFSDSGTDTDEDCMLEEDDIIGLSDDSDEDGEKEIFHSVKRYFIAYIF